MKMQMREVIVMQPTPPSIGAPAIGTVAGDD